MERTLKEFKEFVLKYKEIVEKWPMNAEWALDSVLWYFDTFYKEETK